MVYSFRLHTEPRSEYLLDSLEIFNVPLQRKAVLPSPHCHVAPLRPMILPTFRKRRSAGAPYCVHGCCVPGWADSKFTALPCVVRRARHTHVLMVTSSNPPRPPEGNVQDRNKTPTCLQ